MRRQFARTQGVFMGDVERTDGAGTQRARNELRRRLWKRQRTEGKFDGDFPRAGGREIQLLGGEVRRSLALRLSLCSAARLQRKTLVSSRHFMRSSWLFRSASSFGLRIALARPRATASQNPRDAQLPAKNSQNTLRLLWRHGDQAGHRDPAVRNRYFLAGATRRRSRESWVFASCVLTSFMSPY